MDAELTLTKISTPLANCISVRVGRLDPEVLDRLALGKYDQAPVLNAEGLPIGVLGTVQAKELMSSGRTLEEASDLISKNWIPAETTIRELLHALADQPFALVQDYQGQSVALITLSDLNRHYFRRLLYALFAELEASAARLVDVELGDPKMWIPLLSEESQVRVLGYWELGKMRNVDIGPVPSCTLTDLLRLVRKVPGILQELGLTKKQYEEMSGQLPDWRNRVMHPVRPLVLSPGDVKKLGVALESSRSMANKIRARLGDHGIDWRAPWL